MVKLTQEDFHAQPRRSLDQKLKLNTLTSIEPSDENINQLTIQVASQIFTQTLRSLTLPDPVPTAMLRKRDMPITPMSYTQLKEWRDATIMKLASRPAQADLLTLLSRQHMLYLLTNLEL